ncbi:TPA: formylglycine-generating enzyme family protein [Vibrio alginolyticus]|uniref:formylglycine-generating enzyme family protein n=1 Tax=Vibrio natriegens TaxID=691 RepID=UPI000804354D|nr:formylglycine-generating enzyme family protein [Vibrio natriegens]EGQ9098845.1 SUMF1/EgtB/PvdO family nonheme iron enzyme [Vibrio alginolyticus]ANQ20231.1 protein NirV [Vibrio natriegens]EGR0804645.1 formylglycine-generating enzyme family protein [Vibrio alginolyticus]EGR2553333.1 formylglycine-generating enzyme family protein [Vibrio alginolyticus]EJV5949505.1 formylglycine-generating enzyme family protein [Vibrio alginolyticus]
MNKLIEMVLVSGSPYQRGSDLSPDEQPVSLVTLSDFFIDVHPVTNEEFAVFVNQKGYERAEYWSEEGFKFIQENEITEPLYWRNPKWNGAKQPVTGISWYESEAYANFVGKELPTEAQWEFAAKGNDNRLYPWGDSQPSPSIANYAPDCEPLEFDRRSTEWDAHPQNRSPFGCMDMGGNLAEWCQDNYQPDYSWDKTHSDPVYISERQADHIVRGGSGLHDEDYMRCTCRDNYPPTVRDNIVGLRCVKNL